MIPNVNREAIAQAAMAFIHSNNLVVEASDLNRSDEYVLALCDATSHMQREFLRWIGNSSGDWGVTKIDGLTAIAFAAVIYTCVTSLDIEVKK